MKPSIPGSVAVSVPGPKHGLRWVVVVMVATLAALCVPVINASATGSKPGAGGGGGGGGHGTPGLLSTTLNLISENSWNNLSAPPWCKAEDDYDNRSFTGSLNGSYSTNYGLCNSAVDFYNGLSWDAGGEGLEADVYAVGQVSNLSITAPDGTAHGAVLMGQSTSKGTTTYHYAVCYVPPYHLSTDTTNYPLAGGTWQVTLSGQISSANWTTRDNMTDVVFQQNYCPSSEQNLH